MNFSLNYSKEDREINENLLFSNFAVKKLRFDPLISPIHDKKTLLEERT